MKVVYIIGPFRAENAWEIEQNIRRAEEIALEILRAGAAVICVHTMCRFYQGAAQDDVWLKADLELLRRSDAAYVMPAIWRSAGSQDEVKLCEELKIPTFGHLENIKKWLHYEGVQHEPEDDPVP